jgi:hypothetical protein
LKAFTLLSARVEAEIEHNGAIMAELDKGLHAHTVKWVSSSLATHGADAYFHTHPACARYGDVIQLQHSSGAFVTVCETAAPNDPECRKVELDYTASRYGSM